MPSQLQLWRYSPPNRFDFLLDLESFAFFNYPCILYGMEYPTDLTSGRGNFPNVESAGKLFERIRVVGERATRDLPEHRTLVRQFKEDRGATL